MEKQTNDEVRRVAEVVKEHQLNVVIGLGGGKSIRYSQSDCG